MAKYNLGKSSDMRRFERDFKKDVEKQVQSQIQNLKFDVECPHCKNTVSVSSGRNTCPMCGSIIDVNLK